MTWIVDYWKSVCVDNQVVDFKLKVTFLYSGGILKCRVRTMVNGSGSFIKINAMFYSFRSDIFCVHSSFYANFPTLYILPSYFFLSKLYVMLLLCYIFYLAKNTDATHSTQLDIFFAFTIFLYNNTAAHASSYWNSISSIEFHKILALLSFDLNHSQSG